jgi:hypothetical protein
MDLEDCNTKDGLVDHSFHMANHYFRHTSMSAKLMKPQPMV